MIPQKIILDEKASLSFQYGSFNDVRIFIRYIVEKIQNYIPNFKLDSNFINNILGNIQEIKIEDILKLDILKPLIQAFIELLSDLSVQDKILNLAKDCTFDFENEKLTINTELFEDIRYRKYFIKILKEISIRNIKSFF